MNKILIFGNSGSGKSWLSGELSKRTKLLEVNLDSVFWLPGGYSEKRSQEAIDQRINEIKSNDNWVVEGVFGNLIEKFIPTASEIMFLDLPWNECNMNLINRGSESSKQLNQDLAEKNFKALVTWASEYKNRSSKASYSFHNQLFQSFQRKKHRLKNREEMNLYLSKANSSTCT